MKEIKNAERIAEVTPDELETIHRIMNHLRVETKVSEDILLGDIDKMSGDPEGKALAESVVKNIFVMFYRVLESVVQVDQSEGNKEGEENERT